VRVSGFGGSANEEEEAIPSCIRASSVGFGSPIITVSGALLRFCGDG